MSTENTPSTVTINESQHTAAAANGGSSTKAFAGVISLLLVIAGVYAMMKPMNQNLDYMRQDIKELKLKMDADDIRERVDQGLFSSSKEKFTKVESMFVNLKEMILLRDKEQTKNVDRLEERLSKALIEIARLQECMRTRSKTD